MSTGVLIVLILMIVTGVLIVQGPIAKVLRPVVRMLGLAKPGTVSDASGPAHPWRDVDSSERASAFALFRKQGKFFIYWVKRREKASLAVAAAWMLVAASFVTTFLGMSNFTLWPVALLAALGIQIILYLAAWLVAERSVAKAFLRAKSDDPAASYSADLRRAKATMLTAGRWSPIMFSLGLFVSVFFSFDSLFDFVYTKPTQDLNNLKVARSGIGSLLGTIERKLGEDRDSELGTLVRSSEWKDWKDGLELVLKTAESSDKKLGDFSKQDRDEAKRELDKAQEDFNALDQSKREIKARLDRKKQGTGQAATGAVSDIELIRKRQAQIQERMEHAQKQVDDLERQVREKTAERDTEDKTGGRGKDGKLRPVGKGPEWRELNRQLEGLKISLKSARQELTDTTRELKTEDGKLKEAEDAAADDLSAAGKLEADYASQQKKSTELQQVLDRATARYNRAMGGTAAAAGSAGAIDAVTTVRTSLTAFAATGTRGAWKDMSAGCQSIVNALMKHPEIAKGVNPNACAATTLSRHLGALGQYEDALADYRKKCEVDDSFNNLSTVKLMVDKGRECANLSTLPYDQIKSERGDIDTIEQENSPATSHFQRAWATWKRGDMLAWLTLAIAFVIDFLVFVASMLGARAAISSMSGEMGVHSREDIEDLEMAEKADLRLYPGDPPWVRTQKVLLALMEADWSADEKDEIVGEKLLDLRLAPQEHAAGLRTLLGAYEAKGLARPERGRRGTYRLSKTMVLRIGRQVGRYESDLAERNGPRREEDGYVVQPLSTFSSFEEGGFGSFGGGDGFGGFGTASDPTPEASAAADAPEKVVPMPAAAGARPNRFSPRAKSFFKE